MKNSLRYLLFGVIATIIIFCLPFFVIYPKYLDARNLVKEGDNYVSLGGYKMGLDKYIKAENSWPLYYFDSNLQQKMTNSKAKLASRPSIIIYFKDGSNAGDVNALSNELKNTPGVRDVKYVSKEDALKIYQEMNKNSPELLKLVTASILPASLEVFLNEGASKETILQSVRQKPYVDSVIPISD